MGDMALTRRSWMVNKDFVVTKKEIQVQIQERVSRIARLKQEIEDMMKGIIVGKEADIIMFEKEMAVLNERLESLTPQNFNAPEVIEATEGQ